MKRLDSTVVGVLALATCGLVALASQAFAQATPAAQEIGRAHV